MTESQGIRAKALELAIKYLGARESLTAKERAGIKGLIERELLPAAMAFESLIAGEPSKWGVL